MTPCEKLGYKVGDKFIVTKVNSFPKGCIIFLENDDGSQVPRFSGPSLDGETWAYEDLGYIEKLPSEESLDLTAYTKIEHPDGRIEFIPQGALQGGTKEEPKAPENYIGWDAREGGESYYSQVDHDIVPLSEAGDYLADHLLDSYKLYPTRALAAKAIKLRIRAEAIIKACLLVDPYFEPNWRDGNESKHQFYYDAKNNRWGVDCWANIKESEACVSTKEKAQQVCELLTTWGIK